MDSTVERLLSMFEHCRIFGHNPIDGNSYNCNYLIIDEGFIRF